MKPVYPKEAISRKAEGTTLLDIEVDDQGKVSNTNVLSSSGHDDLDQSAMNFIKSCTYNVPKDMPAGSTLHTKMRYVWALAP